MSFIDEARTQDGRAGGTCKVSSYVEQEDTREVIDITELNAEIARIVSRQQELRTSTDKIVADVPGSFLRGRLRVPGRIRASLDHALERGLITMRGYDRCLRVRKSRF